jgi:hypothetical protein
MESTADGRLREILPRLRGNLSSARPLSLDLGRACSLSGALLLREGKMQVCHVETKYARGRAGAAKVDVHAAAAVCATPPTDEVRL